MTFTLNAARQALHQHRGREWVILALAPCLNLRHESDTRDIYVQTVSHFIERLKEALDRLWREILVDVDHLDFVGLLL